MLRGNILGRALFRWAAIINDEIEVTAATVNDFQNVAHGEYRCFARDGMLHGWLRLDSML